MLLFWVALFPHKESGWATWYGDGNFHGSITATGETFDPMGQTCASRTIPLNTRVVIESQSTGYSTWCRVNDRGPYGANIDGRWVVMYKKKGLWHVKEKDGSEWTSQKKPGKYRGVMDLSLGTARELYQTKNRPPNGKINIYY